MTIARKALIDCPDCGRKHGEDWPAYCQKCKAHHFEGRHRGWITCRSCEQTKAPRAFKHGRTSCNDCYERELAEYVPVVRDIFEGLA